VQLIVMGACDIVTDVVLIAFPIPLVWQSSMRTSKKISLILLFLLSIILIAITAYRVPSTIARHSSQQWRSLLASLEILAAAGVSNAIAIGSFIRDKGVKKARFRVASFDDSSSIGRSITRSRTRSMTHHHWGSDEDLARGVGVALPQLLRHGTNLEHLPPVAEVAMPDHTARDLEVHDSTFNSQWTFTSASRSRPRKSHDSHSSTSEDIKLDDLKCPPDEPTSPTQTEPGTPSKMGFFDVGGLVDRPQTGSPTNLSRRSSAYDASRRASQSNHPGTRSGSKAFLSDVGGLLARHGHIREEDEIISLPRRASSPGRSPVRADKRKVSRNSRLPSQQEEDQLPMRPRPSGPDDLTVFDAGGLLS